MKRISWILVLLFLSAIFLVGCDEKTYTVTWKNYDGTVLEVDENVEKGTIPTYDGNEPTKEGDEKYTYDFTGWSPEVVEAEKDATYVAQFASIPVEYTVTFKVEDEILAILTFTVETESLTPPAIPEKEGFDGKWEEYDLKLFQNQEVEAIYTPKKHTITWKDWNGDVLETDADVEYNTIPEYNGPDLKREGYTFEGWSPNVGKVIGDATYTATYTIMTFTLTFKVGETVVGTVQFNVEMTSVEEPAVPPKEGHDGVWGPYNLQLPQDQEVQAIYTIKKFTVTWENWNGDVLEIDLEVPYDTMPEYNGEEPTKEGYVFNGWEPELSKVVADITYTAKFKGDEALLDNYVFVDKGEGYALVHYLGNESEVKIPAQYHEKPVISIEQWAFFDNQTMTSVTIPNSVTEINADAFNECKSLKNVILGNNVKSLGFGAFQGCIALESINLPEGLTDLNMATFAGCESLTSLSVPNSIESFGGFMFMGVNVMTYSEYANGKYLGNATNPYLVLVEMIDKTQTTITIHNDCKLIADYAVRGGKIETIDFGTGVQIIGDASFSGCNKLTELIIPNNITKIADNAFSQSSVTKVTVRENVKYIGQGAFRECGNLTSVSLPNGIEYIGDSAFSLCNSLEKTTFDNAYYLGNATNPHLYLVEKTDKAIESINIHEDTKIIGAQAFALCKNLTTVTIPKNVKHIGINAFRECNGLTEIIVSPENRAYSAPNKTAVIETATSTLIIGLKNAVIPVEVTSIGDYAFCRSEITSLTIPEGITSIGEGAFLYCVKLESISMPDSLTKIGYAAFSNCSRLTTVTFSNNLQYISDMSFKACDLLTTINIPDSVSYIGNIAFTECKALENVSIGSGVIVIGEDAFRGCIALSSITIPDNVKSIKMQSFFDCKAVTSITIGKGVVFMENPSFGSCINATTLTVDADNKVYDSRENCNAIIETATNTLISGIKTAIVPDSVTAIGDYAFNRCAGLENVTLNDNITSIGSYAFYMCSSLTEIIIPESVVTIGKEAFRHSPLIKIFAEATEKPAGWDNLWNSGNHPAYWYSATPKPDGQHWRYVGGVPKVWE